MYSRVLGDAMILRVVIFFFEEIPMFFWQKVRCSLRFIIP